MDTDNNSLYQVQVDNRYNFKTLYKSTDYLDENGDSPLRQGNQDCIYYEPYQLSQMIEGTMIALSRFHLNCRSLSSNWDAFYNLLCDLHNKEFIIGVSEIFRANRDTRIVLPAYHNTITRCRNDEGRGSVDLFLKDTIRFKVREDLSVFIPHVYEPLFVEVENESHKKIIAGFIYRYLPCLILWKLSTLRVNQA